VKRLAALGVTVAMAAALPAQEQAVFRSKADEVLVDVSVMRGKSPVTGLTATDFVVTDNGVRQVIRDASVNSGTIDVTLVVQREANRFDVATDSRGTFVGYQVEALRDAIDAAAQGARRLIQPADGFRVLTADHDVRLAADSPPRGSRSASAILDGLTAAMMLAPTAVGHRQLVIGITGGTDDRSFVPERSRLNVALHTNAVVHIVALGQGRPAFASTGPSSAYPGTVTRFGVGEAGAPLRPIADATGGRLYQINSGTDIEKMLRPAIEEFRTRYLLRYVPAGVSREGWHDIVVTVPSGSFDIRHRRGYEIRLPDNAQ
jgi:hypothetical protein